MDVFRFPAYDSFLNRSADLARLEDWWSGDDRNALALYGRRRVGKSWLFRRFAHGKPALLLVADRRAEAPQLDRFAARLAPLMGGVQPALPTVASLIEALYAIAAERKILVVLDEFPYLLPARDRDRDTVLTEIQAVMEERDASQLKLMVCGSYIGQMTKLLRGPLRGRLTALAVDPLSFADAQSFFSDDASAGERIERYAVGGGMSLYLDELARGRSLRRCICERVLDPRGPLFNDPREVLEEELKAPGVYYSLLEELSTGKKSIGDLGSALAKRSTDLQGYLETLREMQIVERIAPVTARQAERNHRYSLSDGFMRFWFRFVFPFQEELKTGLAPVDLYTAEIADALADHVSPTFETLCRQWVRARLGERATRVGPWWGNALNELRREGSRTSEEVDIVGLRGGAVTVVGECKWTSTAMDKQVLYDLDTYKIPAMGQAKTKFVKDGPQVLLFAKSGFSDSLTSALADRNDVRLVGLDEIVADLTAVPARKAQVA